MTNRLPKFKLNIELLKSRFVVTRNTPIRINVTAIYPMGFNLSLKMSNANKIEKTVSPLASNAASAAVLIFNPRKNTIGAITAPETALVRIRKKYFVVILDRVLAAEGVKKSPAVR